MPGRPNPAAAFGDVAIAFTTERGTNSISRLSKILIASIPGWRQAATDTAATRRYPIDWINNWLILTEKCRAAARSGRLGRLRALRLRGGNPALQFLAAHRQLRGIGPQQERVDAAIVLDGTDGAGGQ